MRCHAATYYGHQCAKRATWGAFCGLHRVAWSVVPPPAWVPSGWLAPRPALAPSPEIVEMHRGAIEVHAAALGHYRGPVVYDGVDVVP